MSNNYTYIHVHVYYDTVYVRIPIRICEAILGHTPSKLKGYWPDTSKQSVGNTLHRYVYAHFLWLLFELLIKNNCVK